MDSAPASPADATTVYVSLWQTNTVGLRAERFINWKRIGVNSVKYLTAAAWPSPTGERSAADPRRPRNGRKDADRVQLFGYELTRSRARAVPAGAPPWAPGAAGSGHARTLHGRVAAERRVLRAVGAGIAGGLLPARR